MGRCAALLGQTTTTSTTKYIHMYTQKRARGLYNELHPHVHTKESTWTVQRATSTCTHKREHVDCTTSYIRMYTHKRASGLYNEQSSLYEYSPDMLLQTVLCFTHTTTSQSASATLTFFDEAGARGPVRAPLTVVPSLIVPGGILPMEISDSFP